MHKSEYEQITRKYSNEQADVKNNEILEKIYITFKFKKVIRQGRQQIMYCYT